MARVAAAAEPVSNQRDREVVVALLLLLLVEANRAWAALKAPRDVRGDAKRPTDERSIVSVGEKALTRKVKEREATNLARQISLSDHTDRFNLPTLRRWLVKPDEAKPGTATTPHPDTDTLKTCVAFAFRRRRPLSPAILRGLL